ncbi:hypothetical protein D3C78_1356790 [compost metagenome]
MKTTIFSANIKTDDVALVQFAFARKSMYQFFVNRSANAIRKTVVAFERRQSALTANELIGNVIELARRNSRLNRFRHEPVRFRYDTPCFSHKAQFRFGFTNDH